MGAAAAATAPERCLLSRLRTGRLRLRRRRIASRASASSGVYRLAPGRRDPAATREQGRPVRSWVPRPRARSAPPRPCGLYFAWRRIRGGLHLRLSFIINYNAWVLGAAERGALHSCSVARANWILWYTLFAPTGTASPTNHLVHLFPPQIVTFSPRLMASKNTLRGCCCRRLSRARRVTRSVLIRAPPYVRLARLGGGGCEGC